VEHRVLTCRSFWSRLLGTALPGLRAGDVLVFPNTRTVHTFFGPVPAQIRFLSPNGETLKTIETPRRARVYGFLGAASVEERV